MDDRIVTFNDKSTNLNRQRRGIQIGGLILASLDGGDIGIFRKDGKLAIDSSFADLETAKSLAKHINKIYGEYMPIWDDYPHLDIFAITRLTVPGGERFYAFVERITGKYNLTDKDLLLAWKSIKDEHLR